MGVIADGNNGSLDRDARTSTHWCVYNRGNDSFRGFNFMFAKKNSEKFKIIFFCTPQEGFSDKTENSPHPHPHFHCVSLAINSSLIN